MDINDGTNQMIISAETDVPLRFFSFQLKTKTTFPSAMELIPCLFRSFS